MNREDVLEALKGCPKTASELKEVLQIGEEGESDLYAILGALMKECRVVYNTYSEEYVFVVARSNYTVKGGD